MNRVMLSFWVAGGVLYLVSTLHFTNAINPFGDGELKPIAKDQGPPPSPIPSVARVESTESAPAGSVQVEAINPALADRPHAISPEEPSSEAPTATNSPSPVQQEQQPPAAAEETSTVSSPEVVEMLRVTSAASIRSGPSASAEVIGTARAGAEVRVAARNSGWVQFVDPASGKTGWISLTFLAPSAGGVDTALTAAPAAQLPAEAAPPKSKSRLQKPKRITQSPSRQAIQQSPPSAKQRSDDGLPQRQLELPSDEEFLSARKRGRFGIFGRRRMLREGLMTPGFLPPP
jgi:uncharacterized protein YraI